MCPRLGRRSLGASVALLAVAGLVTGCGGDPDVNYQIARASVAWLLARGSMSRLLSLMKAYRTDYQGVDVDALTARLLHQVYGVTEQQVGSGAFGLIGSYQH